MIVIQNDIQACERSLDELRRDFQEGNRRIVLNQLDLEDLIQGILATGQKLIAELTRLKKLNLPESEFEQAEDEWAQRMYAMEKLSGNAMSLVAEFESREKTSVSGSDDLKKMRKHLSVINTFSREDIREARRDIREGRVIPLSAIKNAL